MHGCHSGRLRTRVLNKEDVSVSRRHVTQARALQSFVRGGGSAIVTAFTNWSASNHYNKALYEWLGVRAEPGASFGRRHERELARADELGDPAAAALLSGPFGASVAASGGPHACPPPLPTHTQS